MNNATELHQRAMETAEQALFLQSEGKVKEAIASFEEALRIESEAASLIKPDDEPSYSVLHRSAASLALQAERYQEAQRLAATALAARPPAPIFSELINLINEATFLANLKEQGTTLAPHEFRIHLNGDAVGHGLADSEQVVERVQNFEKIVFRTADRKMGRKFRERGRRSKKEENKLGVFMAVPLAGSFIISLKIGRSQQLALPGVDITTAVAEEVFDCFSLLNSGEREELKKRIPEEAYFRNFIGLAKNILPDGTKIKNVVLTTFLHGRPSHLRITLDKPEISKIEAKPTKRVEAITFEGTLLFADARKEDIIRIRDDDGKEHPVRVPSGMMSDIVKPLWHERVRVHGKHSKKGIILVGIERAEE